MLSIEVLDHGQGVIVRARSHRILVVASASAARINAIAKTVLVTHLTWRVIWSRLNHPISVCFHNLLTRTRLTRHHLAATVDILVVLAFCRGSHAVLLHPSEHVPRVVKIVGSES